LLSERELEIRAQDLAINTCDPAPGLARISRWLIGAAMWMADPAVDGADPASRVIPISQRKRRRVRLHPAGRAGVPSRSGADVARHRG
ncbi:hypothetical protein, partial [Acrocarpospora corrugata]|uniref:hypothetical protein n=1 Tax=Acrocarpospora corrugata TaxID=35763 RepID=UPI001C3FC5CF